MTLSLEAHVPVPDITALQSLIDAQNEAIAALSRRLDTLPRLSVPVPPATEASADVPMDLEPVDYSQVVIEAFASGAGKTQQEDFLRWRPSLVWSSFA